MSLLSPRRRLVVGLAPDAVEYALLARAVPPRLGEVAAGAGGPERWRGALSALAQVLKSFAGERMDCSVLLAGHFVRTELLPWNPDIGGAREYRMLAAARFRAIHGAAAAGWAIRLGPLRYGHPVLACAIDSALLSGLEDLVRACGMRLASVTPHFAHAFDRHRGLISGAGWWFLLVEPGRLWLGRSDGGSWRHVATRVVGDDAVAETMAAIAQESALSADAGKPCDVHAVVTGLGREQQRLAREAGLKVMSAASRRFDFGVAGA